LIPDIDGLSPMEASDLAHEEASHIAKQLAIRARADGRNLIWDITMSTRGTTQGRIEDLRDSRYTTIRGIFVDIPIEVSVSRAEARHRQDQTAFLNGDGLGGRYVPPEITTRQADPEWSSKNRRTFEELKPYFNQWSCYDNGVNGRYPILSDASPREYPEERPS
jgi:Zeta toxin